MRVERIDPDLVTVPDRIRAICPDKVLELAKSMEAIGLQQPITVRAEVGDVFELVAGAHRLAAARKLGWTAIDAAFADDLDELDRQLWEVDENLMRAELSTEERDFHLLRRKQLWKSKKIPVGLCDPLEIGYGKPPPKPKGFAAETAEKTGLSKRTINRGIARAEAAQDHAPKQKAQRPAPSTDDAMLAKAYKWWNAATDTQRRRFIQWVANVDPPGETPISEVVETLRSALRGGRIEPRDRGFVSGILKQSKTGRWFPTPAQEFAARRLAEELTQEPLLES